MTPSDFVQLLPASEQERKYPLSIRFGVADSPFGRFFLAATGKGFCRASFLFNENLVPELEYLCARWPHASFVRNDAWAKEHVAKWFALKNDEPIRLHLAGTEFQLAVWQRLLDIPLAQTSSYRVLAEQVGKPKAFRAVGTAVGQNPITFLVPCHRVLQSGGALGGYYWGLPLKQALLNWETMQAKKQTLV